MQKENPVIKNYIYSSKKRVLKDPLIKKPTFDIYQYRVPLEQNKDFVYLFLLRK